MIQLSIADANTIWRALAHLPRSCRYHGDNLERTGGFWAGHACCSTGEEALQARRARAILDEAAKVAASRPRHLLEASDRPDNVYRIAKCSCGKVAGVMDLEAAEMWHCLHARWPDQDAAILATSVARSMRSLEMDPEP